MRVACRPSVADGPRQKRGRCVMFVGDMDDLFSRTHHVCVVGAGPVGIVVALELASRGHEVTILESGSFEFDPAAQKLSEALRVDEVRNQDMALVVQRRFGGTSNLWGAGCVPLDPVDFDARAIAENARWPISYVEFASFLPDACRYANCGTQFEQPLTDIAPCDDRFTMGGLMRYADPPSFLKAYAQTVSRSARIRAYLGATVTAIRCGADGRVSALRVHGRDGHSGPVRARVVVLACGGVETTRLLLAMQAEEPQRFGGEAGALGRYYMGHLSGALADIRFQNDRLDRSFGFFRLADAAYARRRIAASGAFQHREQLTNIALWPTLPPMGDFEHRDPVLSLAYLALSFPPLGRRLVSESLRRINVGDGKHRFAHVRNVAAGLPLLGAFLPRFLFHRFVAQRRLPGLHIHNPARRYPLHYHAEHLPNPHSRIRLSNDRDVLGLRKVVLDLRFSDRDAEAVVRTHEQLARWLHETGLGALIWHNPAENLKEQVLAQAGDGVHQIGTARMGENNRSAVVDRNCRIFGSSNLFLAGSAVFPTSGQANPTLSAIALAVRLARLLSAEAYTHEIRHEVAV